jgi:hypothetical protein
MFSLDSSAGPPNVRPGRAKPFEEVARRQAPGARLFGSLSAWLPNEANTRRRRSALVHLRLSTSARRSSLSFRDVLERHSCGTIVMWIPS